MKVEDLKLFMRVVELGSFSAAAHSLDLPRANVSRRINDLEKSLQTQLFHRTTRHLSLTNSGEVYHRELSKALEALEHANQQAANPEDIPRGRVKIGLLPESGDLIQPILFSFQDHYPEIELEIRSIHNGFHDLFHMGLDVAMHGGEIFDSNLVARKVLSVKRSLYATPGYLQRCGRPLNLEQLRELDHISYRFPSGEIENKLILDGSTLEIKPRLISDSIGFAKGAVMSGRGVGFLPDIMVQEEISQGLIERLLPELSSPTKDAWVLYPQPKSLNRASRLLVDYLIQEAPKLAAFSS